MDIGLPKERRSDEYRIALTPAAVRELTRRGHRVYVEHDAGAGSGFTDADYEAAGASIVYSPAEAYQRGELVVKVTRPLQEELERLYEGQILMAFLHLASAHPNKVRTLLDHKVTAIALETIQEDDGYKPLLHPIAKLAGRFAPTIAGSLLRNDAGGKGILLGGVPGVPPAEVVIIGVGSVGTEAALAFAALGASVYALDVRPQALEAVDRWSHGRVVTLLATPHNVRKALSFADVVVLAVNQPGYRAPIVVTRELLRTMRPRSVLMDFAIDQGGAAETSRPTHHSQPTFVEENIIHYCVPNVTGVLGRTATHTISNALLPWVQAIADRGLDPALRAFPALARGVQTRDGRIVHPALYQVWSQHQGEG
ncbi:MAG: alanine dehydrogenase [Chloroflexi bacterium]|nr:alanine dehydrogenase [Chloroflexota bacterium]